MVFNSGLQKSEVRLGGLLNRLLHTPIWQLLISSEGFAPKGEELDSKVNSNHREKKSLRKRTEKWVAGTVCLTADYLKGPASLSIDFLRHSRIYVISAGPSSCSQVFKFSVSPDGAWVSVGEGMGKLADTAHMFLLTPPSGFSTVIGSRSRSRSLSLSLPPLESNSSQKKLLSKWDSPWSFINVGGRKGRGNTRAHPHCWVTEETGRKEHKAWKTLPKSGSTLISFSLSFHRRQHSLLASIIS